MNESAIALLAIWCRGVFRLRVNERLGAWFIGLKCTVKAAAAKTDLTVIAAS